MITIREFEVKFDGAFKLIPSEKYVEMTGTFKGVFVLWFIPLFVWQIRGWHV